MADEVGLAEVEKLECQTEGSLGKRLLSTFYGENQWFVLIWGIK